jgi:hypothetical protein
MQDTQDNQQDTVDESQEAQSQESSGKPEKISRTLDLARGMRKVCKDYTNGEYMDFLKIFREFLYRELSAGRDINLYNTLYIRIHQNPDRMTNLTDPPTLCIGGKTLRIGLSANLKKEVLPNLNKGKAINPKISEFFKNLGKPKANTKE